MAGHAVPKRKSGILSPINEMYIMISKSVAMTFSLLYATLILKFIDAGIVFYEVYLFHTASFFDEKIMWPQLFYI